MSIWWVAEPMISRGEATKEPVEELLPWTVLTVRA